MKGGEIIIKKVFNKVLNKFSNENSKRASSNNEENWLKIFESEKDLYSEATYFTCLKLLSETLAKMPLKLYQKINNDVFIADDTDVSFKLKYKPNDLMTPTIFWATIENNRNHYGNAYIWIRQEYTPKKYGGDLRIKDFWVMDSKSVNVYVLDNGTLVYQYTDWITKQVYYFNQDEVLHFKTSATFDGITGKPVREILKDTINTNLSSQKFLNELNENGVSARLSLTVDSDVTEVAKKQLVKRLTEFSSGIKNAGKVMPIPAGMKVQPLDIKLTDAQFLEIRKYTALQIASAFGVKPDMINDYSKSSYNSSEAQQLSFYVDTLQFILKQYEDEINYKLLLNRELKDGYFFKFNEKVLLRTDSSTQAEMLCKYVNNGIYTPNEARRKLDLNGLEHGDKLMMNGNYIPIEQVGEQYKKGGDTN
ncbi:phage portal protein [uncultured Tyzzerella sp.]|uniref:phage portal protein n=1 Tax=uncultured Tyzzerella sp. TaxID=2321398 RepID=UPI0029435AF6|nr:phage portal protein [uncultured Tyzzerella sp.]